MCCGAQLQDCGPTELAATVTLVILTCSFAGRRSCRPAYRILYATLLSAVWQICAELCRPAWNACGEHTSGRDFYYTLRSSHICGLLWLSNTTMRPFVQHSSSTTGLQQHDGPCMQASSSSIHSTPAAVPAAAQRNSQRSSWSRRQLVRSRYRGMC